mgnify:CR=1 FL=1
MEILSNLQNAGVALAIAWGATACEQKPTPPPTGQDTQPPKADMTGPQDNGVYDFNSFCFPTVVKDNVTPIPEISYRWRIADPDHINQAVWTDWQ